MRNFKYNEYEEENITVVDKIKAHINYFVLYVAKNSPLCKNDVFTASIMVHETLYTMFSKKVNTWISEMKFGEVMMIKNELMSDLRLNCVKGVDNEIICFLETLSVYNGSDIKEYFDETYVMLKRSTKWFENQFNVEKDDDF